MLKNVEPNILKRVRTFGAMAHTYPKHEKLKSRTTIELLFSKGQSVTKYPLRLVYLPQTFDDGSAIKMGVSVSKKYFKRAADRNYYKRLLRECYRLHKAGLLDAMPQPHAMMLLYQSNDRLDFAEIEQKTLALFEKFRAKTTL